MKNIKSFILMPLVGSTGPPVGEKTNNVKIQSSRKTLSNRTLKE
jgi:hypothetical protein